MSMLNLRNSLNLLWPRLTRRHFTLGAAAAGFALAVRPVAASTILTDSKGLVEGVIQIGTNKGVISGYRAKPAGQGSFAVVVIVHEIFGLHEHIRDLCRRLAKEGYYAIAPALFTREGDVENKTSIDEIRPIVAQASDAQVMSDIDATVAFAARENADTAKLAITGFCWGGRIVWLYAAHNPQLNAGAAWYGRLTNPSTERQPSHPYDVAGTLKAPVLGLYGGKDEGIPLATVEEMRTRLKTAGSPSQIIVYDEAGHAFNADYRPSYNAKAAADAWSRMLAWFKTNGVA